MRALLSSMLLLFALAANAQTTDCTVIGNQVMCNTSGSVPGSPTSLYPQYQSPQQMQLQAAQATQLAAQAELERQQAEALRQQIEETARLQAERQRLEAERAQLTYEQARLVRERETAKATEKATREPPQSIAEQERAKAILDRLAKDTSNE